MKPKILIFIDWYKPGYKAGGPIRSISNLVDQLHEDVDFYIITSNCDYLENIPYPTIKTDEWNTVDNAQVFYLSKPNTNTKKIKSLIQGVKPDSIYCNSLFSYYFSLLPIYIAKKLKIRTILAVRGMLSKGSLGVKSRKKIFFLKSAKFIGYFKNVIFHATTDDEKKDIVRQLTDGKNSTIIVANNLPQKKSIIFQQKHKNTNELKMVSVARIAPEKNTLFALEILSNCKNNISFDIFGPIYNQDYWNKCLKQINHLPKNITVHYKGALNHDELDETLKNYHVLLHPSTGENFGHIILESMLNACVPIISDKTPWKDLKKQQIGFDIPLENKQLFTEKIDLLAAMNLEKFNEMSLNAYIFGTKINSEQEDSGAYQQLFQL